MRKATSLVEPDVKKQRRRQKPSAKRKPPRRKRPSEIALLEQQAELRARGIKKNFRELKAEKKKGGRAPTDPALLEARGYYEHNPSRRPPGFVAPSKLDEVKARDYVAIAHQYCLDVVQGKIIAGEHTKLACARHLNDLAKSEADPAYPYRYDTEKANAFCTNAERYPHIKGRWAARGEKLTLTPWQCFVLCAIFGWLRRLTGKRRFREALVLVARKNGKSSLAAAIGLNMLLFDEEHGAEVYAGATSEKQAWEVFGPAKLMMQKSPRLCAKHEVEVWAKALVKSLDNGKFWPVIGKPGDGASPHCAIVDEYHEHQTSDLVDTMVTGMGAREQPLLLIITTAGTDLASPCYDKFVEAKKVLEGALINDELFAILYTADEKDDWTGRDALLKANPNIGVSVDEDFLLAQQRQAMQNTAYQNRYRTKHLNQWCSASVAGINMADWRKCADPKLRLSDFEGEQAWFALDLASKIDICCFAKVFKRDVKGVSHYYAFVRHYLPEQTIDEATTHQQSYRKWVTMQRLIPTAGAEIDFDLIRDDVSALASRFIVQEIVYDPWRATQLAQQLAKDGAKVVEMGQTAKNMGAAYDELLSAIKSGRFHHDGDPVLEWMASNVVAKEVMKGLTLPSKEKRENKIDGIVALTMAVSRAMVVDVGGWLANPVMVG